MTSADRSMAVSGSRLGVIFDQLSTHHGAQHWWPAETAFEVMLGAILTQNTAWPNVERALDNLRAADCLDPASIVACGAEQLATWLRPSGYFNIKAKRVKAFCDWYQQRGGYDSLDQLDTDRLRQALLGVYGIGPETADDILLYAFARPVFVIDAYTRRIFSRLGLLDESAGYEQLRTLFEQALPTNVSMYNEFHALIVSHAKEVCTVKPRCDRCVLASECPCAATVDECN